MSATTVLRNGILHGGIPIVLIAVLLEACQVDRPLPQSLGSLTLKSQLGGDRASAILNRMHGKGVTP
ncbi:MAG: hypothetical protein OEM41_09155, partial [Ignavibacteria bacterium]|nr:hypothetical protein [Ignavibacteria bacterium]